MHLLILVVCAPKQKLHCSFLFRIILAWSYDSELVVNKKSTSTLSWLLDQFVSQLDIRDPEAVKVAVDKIEQELGLPSVVRILTTCTCFHNIEHDDDDC